MVDKMLRDQEEYFQKQMKDQYNLFQSMLQNISVEAPESPKFNNSHSKNTFANTLSQEKFDIDEQRTEKQNVG